MDIFIDSCDIPTIENLFSTGLVDGVTTNPTLVRKSGKDPIWLYEQLVEIGIPDISMEVSGSALEMFNEGLALSKAFGTHTTVKLPMTDQGLAACTSLSEKGIRTNVTLIFTPAQAILAAKAGATYVSPFVGRVDDQGFAGLEVVRAIVDVYARHSVSTKVLAASIRTVQRAVRSFYNGAQVVTMPPSVFEGMYNHILTDKGLETFEKDLVMIRDQSQA
jgi:transaldolase